MLISLIILLVAVVVILPWVNFFRIGRLTDDVERLVRDMERMKEDISYKLSKISSQTAPAPVEKTQAGPEKTAPQLIKTEKPDIIETQDSAKDIDWNNIEWREEDSGPAPSEIFYDTPYCEVPSKDSSRIEFNMGAKLPVWIGAVSLACAAFFLVKYTIDIGLLGPATRVVLGLIFGMGLVAAGRYIFQSAKIANNERVGQGMVGAGLVSLTVSLYSAVHLYHIFLPTTGFLGMVAVAAATMALSLRMGAPVAVFGIIGGYLTPALFNTGHENFIGLFSYLFVLYGGLQVVLARKKWWGLSLATLAASFLWAFLSLFSHDIHAYGSVVVMFAVSVSSLTLFLTRPMWKEEENVDDIHASSFLLNFVAIGAATLLIILLQTRIDFGLFEWAITLLLSLATALLTYVRPTLYSPALYGKMAADLVLLALFASHSGFTDAALVGSGIAAIYTIAPWFAQRRSASPTPWVVVQTISALALYLIFWAQFKESALFTTLDFRYKIWGVTATLFAAAAVSQIPHWRKKGHDFIVAAYASTATAFLSAGMAIELPHSYLPAAFAAEAAALLWIYRYVPIAFTQKIAVALTSLVVLLNIPIIGTFLINIARSVLHLGVHLSPEMLSLTFAAGTYLIPSAFLGAAFYLYHLQREQDSKFLYILFILPLLGIAATLYTVVRTHGFEITTRISGYTPFLERGIYTLMVAGLGWGLLKPSKTDPIFKQFGSGLLMLALARIVYFDGFLYNPILDGSQNAGEIPIFNGLTLTYGTGLLISIYALRNKLWMGHSASMASLFKGLVAAFLFILITFNIRHMYHNPILTRGYTENSELYTYSVVWLFGSLLLLGYGIKLSNIAIRKAGFWLLSLTIVKVFLIDAAHLEGLLRIFSFLGLGASLIGLSVFYTRFLNRAKQED
ncbi:MAG TPA: DUF2339 domain-containing protein [Alphaproteobacteria bacterium]|nr:DUF2339 domain-containing protein [Alphaproteobacteria bacterium]HNS44715.1 DUF2339 domain-containing protein [Alphaproteobacteria bacterium]